VGGFDKRGTTLPAEMLPRRSLSTMCNSNLLRRRPACAMRFCGSTGTKRLIFQPATITACTFWRLPRMATRKATFEVGGKSVETEYSGLGRIRWPVDDRQWSSKDTSHDDYGEMMGIKPATSSAPSGLVCSSGLSYLAAETLR